jgi:hypothetical protein
MADTEDAADPEDPADPRDAALAWARHLREVRSSVLGALESGELSLEQCFAMVDDQAVGAVHVGRLVEALPWVRKVDARRAMAAAGLSGEVSLTEVPVRDRAVVLEIAEGLRP